MKTIHQKIIPLGIGALAALPAFAIEAPKDDAPPPPRVRSSGPAPADEARVAEQATQPRAQEPAEAAAAVEEATAFIGIISDDIPEVLAAHIGVQAGKGVMVRDLAPGGPAEKAGFARYDVITRVGGKPVGTPAELSRQISKNKPGDQVTIDLIHAGQPAVKTVTLEARPHQHVARNARPRPGDAFEFEDMAPGQGDRLRDMIERRLQGLLEEQRNRFDTPGVRGNGIHGFQFRSDATFRLMDNDGSIEMKSSDNSKEITVRDHDGNVKWSGPWDTEQDKSAAPPEIRERIERFKFEDGLRGGGFQFRMGPRER